MLSRAFIRRNPEAVRRAVDQKALTLDVDALLAADADELATQSRLDDLQGQRQAISKRFQRASAEERTVLQAQSRALGEEIDQLRETHTGLQASLQELLWQVPNLPWEGAPVGPDAGANTLVRQWGTPPTFSFTPRDHVELLEMHGWADFDRIGKVSGSRTYALRSDMVLLESALQRFMFDLLVGKGFTLLSVPSLVREPALYGMGQFPKARDDVYYLPADDLYLSGTAEVILTGLHMGEILSEADLPLRYAGFSACFRRESGSFGRDVRGLLRVHQFYKVEQYVMCRNDAEESAHWHAQLLAAAEEVLQALELPYQVVECSTGDMGLGKFRMNDLETWLPAQQRYFETHSCSTLHDWQARRANLRYRTKEGKVEFVHTLNNTGIATPRIIAPLLENHQLEDGRVAVPQRLQPYLGGREALS
ncbi:MAG TPA: serine--tRNA ligase [Chloroflexota bacterium]|nr:serine--tRNA ligase [Chloroflexota bacterium]